jgi:uncharacterized membrane protein YccF (DUF307 family)
VKTVGNILWFVLCGIWSALAWLFLALLLAITIIGIPFARQCLKLADFTAWPFGRTTVPSPTARPGGTIGNILWFIPGVLLAIQYAMSGVFLCITIIGIPFGLQAFKFIPLALMPFGKEVVKTSEVRDRLATASVGAASTTISGPTT